jgi:hypothetical protein
MMLAAGITPKSLKLANEYWRNRIWPGKTEIGTCVIGIDKRQKDAKNLTAQQLFH